MNKKLEFRDYLQTHRKIRAHFRKRVPVDKDRSMYLVFGYALLMITLAMYCVFRGISFNFIYVVVALLLLFALCFCFLRAVERNFDVIWSKKDSHIPIVINLLETENQNDEVGEDGKMYEFIHRKSKRDAHIEVLRYYLD